jgi:hypothetical protein
VWAPTEAPPTAADLSGGDPPTWSMARLHVWTPERLRVIAMREGHPAVVATIEVVEHEAPGRKVAGQPQLWRVVDRDGATWIISRGPGCGCGHPLKRAKVDQL